VNVETGLRTPEVVAHALLPAGPRLFSTLLGTGIKRPGTPR
jgi:hypothetical protein